MCLGLDRQLHRAQNGIRKLIENDGPGSVRGAGERRLTAVFHTDSRAHSWVPDTGLSEGLREGMLHAYQKHDAALAQRVGAANVAARDPVDDLPRPLAVDHVRHPSRMLTMEVGRSRSAIESATRGSRVRLRALREAGEVSTARC